MCCCMSGRIHRVEFKYYSRSPLSEPEHYSLVRVLMFEFRCRGDSQGSISYYSHSPLSEPEFDLGLFFVLFNSDVGEIHRVVIF